MPNPFAFLGAWRGRNDAPLAPGRIHRGPGPNADLQDALTGGPLHREVDAQAFGYLQQAEKAIQSARMATPDGQGNQWKPVERSEGLAYARLTRARTLPHRRVQDRAFAARFHGGAHCDEYAAMTYCHLIAQGVKGEPILRGHLRSGGHEFTMIGDPRQPGNPIVVDAWVNHAQAVAWKDFRWNTKGDRPFYIDNQYNDPRPNPDYDFSGIRPTTMNMAEARRLVGVPSNETLLEHIKGQRGIHKRMFDDDWATVRGVPIDYTQV